MRMSLLSFLLLSAIPLRMSDAEAAAAPDPADVANTAAVAAPALPVDSDVGQAPAAPAVSEPTPLTTVTIADVPAAHADLLERVGALLKKDLGWLKDNIEAGISHFEGLFKDDTPPTA